MIVHLIAIGNNMPNWVKDGFDEYQSRLRNEVQLKMVEIPAQARKKNADISKILKEEGQKIDADVKNYHEVMVQGDQTLDGMFTGSVATDVRQWMFTVPVQASLRVCHNVDLRFGPYVSVLTSKGFSGYAHNGYLRQGDPTGPKVIIGDTPGTMGYYNFSSDMRRFQWGVGVGADWIFWHNWGLYGEVNWGLSGLHKSSFHVLDQTLYPIFGQVGVIWKAGKKSK